MIFAVGVRVGVEFSGFSLLKNVLDKFLLAFSMQLTKLV